MDLNIVSYSCWIELKYLLQYVLVTQFFFPEYADNLRYFTYTPPCFLKQIPKKA